MGSGGRGAADFDFVFAYKIFAGDCDELDYSFVAGAGGYVDGLAGVYVFACVLSCLALTGLDGGFVYSECLRLFFWIDDYSDFALIGCS